jgi:mRNA interferase MazF
MTYSNGDIVLAVFPFSTGDAAKARPALVVFDSGDSDVVLARMTTQPRFSAHDFKVIDWSGAGLRGPSTIRLHKLFTVAESLIHKPLGHLTPADHQRVSAALAQMFGNW